MNVNQMGMQSKNCKRKLSTALKHAGREGGSSGEAQLKIILIISY